jgi:hypothetical protein
MNAQRELPDSKGVELAIFIDPFMQEIKSDCPQKLGTPAVFV